MSELPDIDNLFPENKQNADKLKIRKSIQMNKERGRNHRQPELLSNNSQINFMKSEANIDMIHDFDTGRLSP